MPTPLSERFYAAWKADGRTLDAISRATGVPVATVSAYINGTRGGGGQQRSVANICALAVELGVDETEALKLAGLSSRDGVATMIDADRLLTRAQKATMKMLLRSFRDPTRW